MKGLFPDIELVEPEPSKRRPKKAGHYASPGTGPKDETCGTCRYLVRIQLSSKAVHKCELARHCWTHGPGSDIRCKDAACGGWKPAHPLNEIMGPEGSHESREHSRDEYDALHAKIDALHVNLLNPETF